MSVTIETKKTKDHLLISIPTNEISAEEIEQFISSLTTEFILRKSEITEDEAEVISEEIKSDWWEKNGSRIKKLVNK
ncbi:MAG: hypothetical protein M3405_10955 [Acidobacteriota bacterium]|jgi:hypothetical protein|nr:hypothetical protein [Acidobacteriota bacterium]